MTISNKTAPILIGIAGTNGSGKDTVGRILAEHYNFMFISGSDMLREELARRGLPPARHYTRELSAEWRRKYGLGVLIDKSVKLFEEQPKKYNGLAMASLRNPGEADRLHELGGKLIWIDADAHIRYQRVQANSASRGAHRAVDDQKSFKQFLADEAAEMEHSGDEATLSMSGVKEKADFFIDNNGSDPEFLRQLIAAKLGL